jgi:hypothetical protein
MSIGQMYCIKSLFCFKTPQKKNNFICITIEVKTPIQKGGSLLLVLYELCPKWIWVNASETERPL